MRDFLRHLCPPVCDCGEEDCEVCARIALEEEEGDRRMELEWERRQEEADRE